MQKQCHGVGLEVWLEAKPILGKFSGINNLQNIGAGNQTFPSLKYPTNIVHIIKA